MATSPTILFRGQKSLNNRNIDLIFVEHDASQVIEIIGVAASSDLNNSQSHSDIQFTDRIYVAADKLFAAVTADEQRKHASTEAGSSSSGEMNSKDLRNVAVQLLIDALTLDAANDNKDKVSMLLSPISFGAHAATSSDHNSETTTTNVDVRLETKPEHIQPFIPPAADHPLSARPTTVSGILGDIAQVRQDAG
jgi:hypothetical protein